jgi:hypothetical protein
MTDSFTVDGLRRRKKGGKVIDEVFGEGKPELTKLFIFI